MQQSVIQGFRLSPQQDRLWSLQGDGGELPYRATCVLRITGRLDVQALQAALGRVVERHEILRTTFRQAPGMEEPLQVIGESAAVRIERCELRGGSSAAREASVDALFLEASRLPLDIENGENGVLLRARLGCLAPDRHLLLLVLPALCADATSLENLAADLARCYAALCGGPAPGETAQYADIADWMNGMLATHEEVARRFWGSRDVFARLDTRLPLEREPAGTASFTPRSVPVEVASATVVGVAPELGATEEAVLLTAWQILLRRLTAWPETVVGVAFAGRKHAELRHALGLFTRHLPAPCAWGEEDCFAAAVRATAEALAELSGWQESFTWRRLAADGGLLLLPLRL